MFVADAKGSDELPVTEATFIDFLPLVLALFSIPITILFVKTGSASCSRRGSLDAAITPMMAGLLCLFMLLLGSIGAWLGQGLYEEGTIEQNAVMYGMAMLAQIPVILIFAILRRKCRSKHVISVAALSFLVFVPLTLAVAGVSHMVFSLAGWEPETELGHTTLVQLASEPWSGYALVIVLCVTLGAGIMEEVLFRGLLFPLISTFFTQKNLWKPIMVTSALFVFMHYGVAQPSAMLGLFVFSAGLCWARVKSGGVLAPIIVHILFNAMNIAIVYSTEL